MIRFQGLIQTFCLVLFLILLTIASISGLSMSSVNFFLRMDPALVFITAITARIILFSFIPAAVVLLSVPFIGRVFCGYICPMGTTLDVTDALFRSKNKTNLFSKNQIKNLLKILLKIKYFILLFLIGSALFGVSYVFFASPLSLITRFYGLIIFPIISFLLREILDIIRPLGDILNISSISFAQVRTTRFATQFFILFFFITVSGMIIFSPRFWCRFICPSGALLAFFPDHP
jgi:polyferredoxin